MQNNKLNQHYTVLDAGITWGLFLGAGLMLFASYSSIKADDRKLRVHQQMEAIALQMSQSESFVMPEVVDSAPPSSEDGRGSTRAALREARVPAAVMSNSTAEVLPNLKHEIHSGEIGKDPWGSPYAYRVFQRRNPTSSRIETVVRLVSAGSNLKFDSNWDENQNLSGVLKSDDQGLDLVSEIGRVAQAH